MRVRCWGVGPGQPGGERRADEQDPLLQRIQTAVLPDLSFLHPHAARVPAGDHVLEF